jgi:hypothetical protein
LFLADYAMPRETAVNRETVSEAGRQEAAPSHRIKTKAA